MKTSGEIVADVFKIVKAANITPNVFKYERPLNFTGKCIVINSLPVSTEQFQVATININYFVPNLKIGANPVDETQPDSVSLNAGERAIAVLFQNLMYNGSSYFDPQLTQMANDGLREWFVNARINFRNDNI